MFYENPLWLMLGQYFINSGHVLLLQEEKTGGNQLYQFFVEFVSFPAYFWTLLFKKIFYVEIFTQLIYSLITCITLKRFQYLDMLELSDKKFKIFINLFASRLKYVFDIFPFVFNIFFCFNFLMHFWLYSFVEALSN